MLFVQVGMIVSSTKMGNCLIFLSMCLHLIGIFAKRIS